VTAAPVLPMLIVAGLATRLAALGMIAFIAVQSFVDVAFHHADAATIGALFDRLPGAVILDRRALWIFLLVVLVVKGAGALSLDRVFGRLLLGTPAASPTGAGLAGAPLTTDAARPAGR
jgi:putative oxidoreductase